MPRLARALLLTVVLAGCDSGATPPTTAPPGAPSTTIENDTCRRLAADSARFLEALIEVLDATPLRDIQERARWPEGMVALEQQSKDLDARARSMRCDPGDVQAAAFLAADLDPDSDLARYLLTLMGR